MGGERKRGAIKDADFKIVTQAFEYLRDAHSMIPTPRTKTTRKGFDSRASS